MPGQNRTSFNAAVARSCAKLVLFRLLAHCWICPGCLLDMQTCSFRLVRQDFVCGLRLSSARPLAGWQRLQPSRSNIERLLHIHRRLRAVASSSLSTVPAFCPPRGKRLYSPVGNRLAFRRLMDHSLNSHGFRREGFQNPTFLCVFDNQHPNPGVLVGRRSGSPRNGTPAGPHLRTRRRTVSAHRESVCAFSLLCGKWETN